MSTKIINSVAAIFTGHTLRTKVENDVKGDCVVIQTKDLNSADYTKLQATSPYKIAMNDVPKNQFLTKNDILLLSKGTNNKAVLYEGQFPIAIAASAFTIIRIKSDEYRPEFITWYINSQKAQEYFNSQRAGTTTLNLSKKAIEELEIPVVSLAKQESMLKLVHKYDHYKTLMSEYEQNTRLLVETILNNKLNDE